LRPRRSSTYFANATTPSAELAPSDGEHYVLRDVDGTPITEAKGRAIVTKHYRLDPQRRDNIRHKLMRERRKQAAGRASQKSQSAPTSRPTTNKPTSPHPA
jgi:hypothetical protein